ncbi:MAG TPA: N-acetyltransferase [Gemmatimonadales bacterium]|nr:N-acetyltransferase [Gemmatimonadales bacterium]
MIEIRRAGLSEVDLIAPLFDAYRGFYGRASDLPLARGFLADRLARGESVVFLATDGATPCGFTQLYPLFSSLRCRPIWILSDLFVTPGRRRDGTGRKLMEAAHVFAQSQGAIAIELDTAHTNTAAQALYESLGYERDLEFRHYALSL